MFVPGLGLEFNILIVSMVQVGTSNLPLPGRDPEHLLSRGMVLIGLNQVA